MIFSERFLSALNLAVTLHKDQVRKTNGAPYIGHLLGVAALVIEHGGNEDEAMAALLHDAVEDQGGRPVLKKIEIIYGSAVAGIVDGCTDAYEDPKPPWRERKQMHIDRLASASESEILVYSADKVYNLRAMLEDYRRIGEEMWGPFKGGKDGTIWYYRTMHTTLKNRHLAVKTRDAVAHLLDEYDRVCMEFEHAVYFRGMGS